MKKIYGLLLLAACNVSPPNGPPKPPEPPVLEVRDAKLEWDPNTDTVAGYRLHYGTTSRDYPNAIDVKTETTAEVKDLPKEKIYFSVTAYSADGMESVFSNEVSIDYTKTPPEVNNNEAPAQEPVTTSTLKPPGM